MQKERISPVSKLWRNTILSTDSKFYLCIFTKKLSTYKEDNVDRQMSASRRRKKFTGAFFALKQVMEN
jgi:hypothetical protein